MNVIGRQMQRSGANSRQYSDNDDSSNFIEVPSKWLQSANLPQDYGLYGGEGGSKWNRNLQRGNSGLEFPLDPPSPLNSSRSSSLRKTGDDDGLLNEISPGLLDIHSFDTELIPEMPARNLYDVSSLNQPARGKGLEESDAYLAANKNTNKANSVAKIKVVVRKRPLNKREIAKNEDDIITIEPNSNALTVHETKLKVSTLDCLVS